MRRRPISARYAKAIRELIVAADENVAKYGTQGGGCDFWQFVRFGGMTGPERFQMENYVTVFYKKLDQRLDKLPDEEATAIRQKAQYWRLDYDARQLLDVKAELGDLKERVDVVENRLGITI